MNETKCLICGAVVFTSAARDICNECANPETSTIVDHIAELTAKVERLERIEAAARAFVNSDGRSDPPALYKALKDALA